MNKHAHTTQQDVPFLTPAEQVQALIDAFARCQRLSQMAERLRTSLRNDVLRTTVREMLCDQRDDAVIAQNRARIEVVAHVKILMGSGQLERCVEILRTETAGWL